MSKQTKQYYMNLYMKQLPDPPTDFDKDIQKKHILLAYLTNNTAVQQAHKQIAQIIGEPYEEVRLNFLRVVLPYCQFKISSSVLNQIKQFYIEDEGHNDMIAFVKEKMHQIFDNKFFNHTHLDRQLRNNIYTITKKEDHKKKQKVSHKKQLMRCELDAFVTNLVPQTANILAYTNYGASFTDIQNKVDQQFKGIFIHHEFKFDFNGEDESAHKSQPSERHESSNVNTFETVLNYEPDCGQIHLAVDSFSPFKCNQFQNISVTGSCPNEFEDTQ
ncbi:Hypothetical_protein [Hexamita inflata]|uniref:Hypothetical_protein n=1 Tax=Hexamita inflata TaxID=28002 RepID=A0ABP1IZF4_9EUKA